VCRVATKTLAKLAFPALSLERDQNPHGRIGLESPGHRDTVAQGVRDTNCRNDLLSRPMVGNALCLYEAISQRLDALQAEVRQGGNLDTAAFFARFLLNSRILDLLSDLEPQGRVLRIDSALARWKASELLRSVQDIWRSGKAAPAAETATLQSMTRKLDLLAGAVSTLIDNLGVPPRGEGASPERRAATPGERLTLSILD